MLLSYQVATFEGAPYLQVQEALAAGAALLVISRDGGEGHPTSWIDSLIILKRATRWLV
jgi:hypothetical protein